MAAAIGGSRRYMRLDSTRRYALRLPELRHIPNLPAGEIRSGRPSRSVCGKPPAHGSPSSSRDSLEFRRWSCVKSSARLFKKSAHVVGLKDIAAKEAARRSRGRNFTDHIECVLVRRMPASTENQDWYGTFFPHRTHLGRTGTV